LTRAKDGGELVKIKRIKVKLGPMCIILLVAVILSSCKSTTPGILLIGGPITITPPPTEAVPRSDTPIPSEIPTVTPEPTTTRIFIDGYAGDWEIYPILLTDWEDDASMEGFDLKSVRAFTNDQYLYLMLESYGEIGDYVQIDLIIDINGDGAEDYIVSFQPRSSQHELGNFTGGDPFWSLMMGCSSAEREIVEIKLPIGFLGGTENFIIRDIRVMAGECYEEDWVIVDEMGPVSVVRTNELEMTFHEKYTFWSSASFIGPANSPFIINDKGFEGARGLALNQDETGAYVINQYSGELSFVDLDPASPSFGGVRVIKEDIYVLNDIAISQDGTIAFLSREAGTRDPPQGQNVITRLYLETGQVVTVVDEFNHPTNIVLSQDEKISYVVDLEQAGFYKVDLGTSIVTPIAIGLDEPYAVDVDDQGTFAYVVTKPPKGGEYLLGGLLRIFLRNGNTTSIVQDEYLGPTSITLAAEGRLAFITEYGHEGKCDGNLSAINIDSSATDYGSKIVLVTGLCGPHDVKLNQEETLAYFVEVEGSRLSVVRVNIEEILHPSPQD
jgi:DNA-binding beta-propeller fold protein YncE